MSRVLVAFASLCVAAPAVAETAKPFAVEVVDEATGRGVPLVELETVNHQAFVTDSRGLIAIDQTDLMGQKVFFHVRSHGYEFPKDGFGYRGKAIEVEPGGRAQLRLKRHNIAERLYRLTGGGIYSESVRLGRPAPIRDPLLNAQVFGCDSIMTARYRGKLYWFWGDTLRPSYPLGNFHITGATTPLSGAGGPRPDVGFDFDYFKQDDGFVRPTCQMPGDGPTWIAGLSVLKDKTGRERLYAAYVKIRPPLDVYERGAVVWDDARERFEKLATFPDGLAIYPDPQIHGLQHAAGNGPTYVHFNGSFPLVRVLAEPVAFADPGRYEGYTCLLAGTRPRDHKVDRDRDGRIRYGWKRATPPLSQKEETAFLKSGDLKPGEALIALRDIETGRPVTAHNGSTFWNEYRKRWVLIVSEAGGSTSYLGEIWYAEADALEGPWVYARKILTHDKYSFYNPYHHPYFDEDGGRVVYFEGTYTRDFSGNPVATPRYDYNQVMYRLDLADARLNLPVAIDALADEPDSKSRRVEFFALDRPGRQTVPVYSATDEKGNRSYVAGQSPSPGGTPAFHARRAESPPASAADTAPLHEFTSEGSGPMFLYSTVESIEGYRRSERPLCRVWINPIALSFPREAATPPLPRAKP